MSEFIGSIHIKDRPLNSTTVPLGQGNADFSKVFSFVKKINFNNPFILQSARNDQFPEKEWAKQNKKFIENFI